MAALKKAPFLVLDDLGAERLTDWAAERLYLVVNHRYLHRLQTVATTNAKGAMDLVARLGDQGQRIVSRLGEMGTWCGITAEDYRFLPRGETAPVPAGSRPRGNGKHRDSDRQAVMADIPF